jgi:hypothetical protein
MCKFFSLVSDGAGNIMYFNSEERKQILAGKTYDKNGNKIIETDSHTSIFAYNGIYGKEEDWYNKYEYNPLTKEFVVDTLNNKNDSKMVKEKCLKLDFKTIVPELQIKDIIDPINIKHSNKVNDNEIALLKKWDSVRGSVWVSVGDSVWISVGGSVRGSVWDCVGGYISSFYVISNWKYVKHEENKNPFQSCIDLWNLGLIPSFDGKVWRLHRMCNNAEIIYEWIPNK